MSPIAAKKILVVKNRAMGDAVMGLGGLAYLRTLYPNAHITYAIPAWISPLFEKVKVPADEVFPLDLKGIKGWWQLFRYMRRQKFDFIYEFFQSGRTSKFFTATSSITGAAYYYHDHHKKSGGPVVDQGMIKPVIQRDLDGLWSQLASGTPRPNYIEYCPSFKFEEKVGKKKRVVLGVVATRDTKMWPLEFFVELSKTLLKEFPNYEITIPLSQSSRDLATEAQLREKGLPSQVEFVRQPLEFLPLYLRESSLYIGNDTGLKHIAIAAGTKTYTFFGPEPPLEWHPYSIDNHPYFYREGLECRTREAHYCGLSTCDSMICLNQIFPKDVFQQISGDL